MKLVQQLGKLALFALTGWVFIILFNFQLNLTSKQTTESRGDYFISESCCFNSSILAEDLPIPVDNEEDEGDEDDNESDAEPIVVNSYDELDVAISYKLFQDQKHFDPYFELIAPPPKN